jgi:hypothetical protein
MARRPSEQPETNTASGIPLPSTLPSTFQVEDVPLASLRPHPRNYQDHPQDELDQIKASILEHGIFRNVVIAQDNTILAGHGVCLAAGELGLVTIPVRRLPYHPDDPRAIKVLIADNEIRHLAERDDRRLTELLRELADADTLLGTGYDEMMVANLLLVTRPTSEIPDSEAATQWVGLPDYQEDGSEPRRQVIVNLGSDQDFQEFCTRLGLDATGIGLSGRGRVIWWPPREKADLASVYFGQSVGDDPGDDPGDDEGGGYGDE